MPLRLAQWNLRIKDTLGSATLSSVGEVVFFSLLWERGPEECPLLRGCLFLGRLKMYYCYGKGVQKSVLCREVVPFLDPVSSTVYKCLYSYTQVAQTELE